MFAAELDQCFDRSRPAVIRSLLPFLLAFSLLAAFAQSAGAAAGDIDPTFGNAGKFFLVVPPPFVNTEGRAMVVQPDGKTVVVGELDGNTVYPTGVVERFTANGAPDPSFGDGGQTLVELGPNTPVSASLDAVALQPDGKIVVAGSVQQGAADKVHKAVARLNANGVIDSSFGSGGNGWAIKVRPSSRSAA